MYLIEFCNLSMKDELLIDTPIKAKCKYDHVCNSLLYAPPASLQRYLMNNSITMSC